MLAMYPYTYLTKAATTAAVDSLVLFVTTISSVVIIPLFYLIFIEELFIAILPYQRKRNYPRVLSTAGSNSMTLLSKSLTSTISH